MKGKVEEIAKLVAGSDNFFSIQDGKFYTERNLAHIISELDRLGVEYHSETSFLWIEENQPDTVCFVAFEKMRELHPGKFISHNVCLFDLNGSWAVSSHSGLQITIAPQATPEQIRIITNCVSYSRILHHLLKKSEPEDLLYDGDYNVAEGVIVLHSSSNGVFKILHKQSIPEFSQSITQSGELLIKYSTGQYKPYFINALFATQQNELSISIEDLILNARTLTDSTRRNFELAQKQFDFAKFKDALLVEKDKYFSSIRDVVGKIFTQVIGIPISLTGAVYASYKLSGDQTAIVVIIIAFIIYTFFYLILQYGNYRDLKELRRDFMRSFVVIRTKSGLPKAVVNREYQVIIGRFRRYLRVLRIIMLVVITLMVLAAGYMLAQLSPAAEINTNSFHNDTIRDTLIREAS